MNGLSPRQLELLDFLRETVRDTGRWPRVSEVQRAMGWKSNSSVIDAYQALRMKGAITASVDPSHGGRVWALVGTRGRA